MRRRGFMFWVGLGLFSLAEKLRADSLDHLAAALMEAADAAPSKPAEPTAEHWTASENNDWRWFERENLIDGRWKLSGITRPVHKETGERSANEGAYLDDLLVPESMRRGQQESHTKGNAGSAVEEDSGKPSPMRRARHGRPPSRWLRSLNASELRLWLKTIDVPAAGVEGMTYWEHLTRDHSFDPKRIAGLTEDEQARLHAAAHYGY